jgi:hypothetical protein
MPLIAYLRYEDYIQLYETFGSIFIICKEAYGAQTIAGCEEVDPGLKFGIRPICCLRI